MNSFSCSIWDLVPPSGIESRPHAMGAWSLSHWTTWELPPTLVFEKMNPLPNVSSSPSTSTNLLRSSSARTSSSASLEALRLAAALVQTHLCVGKYASPQCRPEWSSAHLCSPATLASWSVLSTDTQTQVLTEQEGENSFLYKTLPWKAANRLSWTPEGHTIWDESSSDFFVMLVES